MRKVVGISSEKRFIELLRLGSEVICEFRGIIAVEDETYLREYAT